MVCGFPENGQFSLTEVVIFCRWFSPVALYTVTGGAYKQVFLFNCSFILQHIDLKN